MDGTIRHDWTVDQIVALHELSLLELVGRANAVHRQHHDPNKVQKASLLSIKTGGCPENCAYCPQSDHRCEVDLTRDKLMDPESVVEAATTAKEVHSRLTDGRHDRTKIAEQVDFLGGVLDARPELPALTQEVVVEVDAQQRSDPGVVEARH